jgi:hypothetical protein
MFEVTKLIRKIDLIFLIANVASVGMFGLSFYNWIANSFMDSRIAKNSVSVCSGLFSGKSLLQ